MDRKEIINSQEYKAEGFALNWYKSLSGEQVGDIHITDAYAEGVIYGWNHPDWRNVRDELPQPIQDCNLTETCWVIDRYDNHYAASYFYRDDEWGGWYDEDGKEVVDVAYWMPIVPPTGKEDNYEC